MPKRKYDLAELYTGKENSIPYIKSESNVNSRLTIVRMEDDAEIVAPPWRLHPILTGREGLHHSGAY